MTEHVIEGARWKSALLLLFSVVAAGGCAYALAHGETAWEARLGVGFFVVCTLVAAAQLIQPQRLVLGAESFTYRGLLGRSWTVRWADVERFELWSNPEARQTLVTWSFRPSAPRGEHALPGGWPMAPRDLLNQMEACR